MKAHSGRGLRWIGLFMAAAIALPTAGLAVTDEEIFRDFRFNLANPGARSLGLGGAFIAVADDATASLSNPSGLVRLSRPEVFGEIRQIDGEETENSSSGTFATIDTLTTPDSVLSPSFFAYAYPWKRFAVAGSYQELTNVDNEAAAAFVIPGFGSFESEGTIETKLSVINVSGAVKIVESLTFGGTVAFGRLSMDTEVFNFAVTGPVLTPIFRTEIDDSDSDVAFNAGLHWKPLPSLSFGAVYRGGYEFETDEEGTAPGGQSSSFVNTFNTPDSYGAGVAWQPVPALTVSADWVHIKYTDILEGFVSGLNAGVLFTPLDFTIEDADEGHIGIEYVFSAGTVPWAIRAGAFTDHNTRIFGDETPGNTTVFGDPDAAAEVFPERDTEVHYTVGGGVVLKQRYQIDVAASISDLVNEYVLSGIFRF